MASACEYGMDYWSDKCHQWNLSSCPRGEDAGDCVLAGGRRLAHLCNFKKDYVQCGGRHPRIYHSQQLGGVGVLSDNI